jgi:apolipoprotein N-acyltransferase
MRSDLGISIPGGAKPASGPRSRLRAKAVVSFNPALASAQRPGAGGSTAIVYLTAVAGGVAIALGWLVPETAASALLGWLGAFLLIYSVRARRAYVPAYCCGLALHVVGFYWIYQTVAVFGDFGALASALIFTGFVATGALMFSVFAFVHHNLGPGLDRFALRSPIAMVVAELVTIRLFPWHIGHTQIAFVPFAQVAGLAGVMLITFVLFWCAEVLVRLIIFQERRRTFLLPAGALASSLAYGLVMMRTFAFPSGTEQEVLLVQGNGSAIAARDVETAQRTLDRICRLTRNAAQPDQLIVWPEGVIPAYFPADVGSVRNEPMLPWLANGSAFLVGGYSYLGQDRYNTAFAVYRDGRVPMPYFKQILIPFGEYIPGAGLLPWLKGLNNRAGIFAAGTEVKVFDYRLGRREKSRILKASPLICYEDIVPSLAREATRRGAQLLVNLTYDTWFGRSAAPFQHHLIAVFRAIENRRFLVRATDSGYSAVVDPLGRTIAHIPAFAEGTAAAKVVALDYSSPYTQYVGEKPWWALLVVAGGLVARNRVRRRES